MRVVIDSVIAPVQRITGGGATKEIPVSTHPVVQQDERRGPPPPATWDGDGGDQGPDEEIVVVSRDGRVILLEEIPCGSRLLALPPAAYRLEHSYEGTVLLRGLVLCGAVPLAYRSLKYALDYPGLAQAVVASVAGTVAYSLWASREGARTRQRLAVVSAAASRTVARDGAAVLVLRDGAAEKLAEAVMAEYLIRLDGEGGKVKKNTFDEFTSVNLPSAIAPVDIAVDLGLLVQKNSERAGRDFVAVKWDKAHSQVVEYLSSA
mmetsp:Transcript_17363/g.26478  ORF Transcript_17363/g.26478 Transcript_17363/m.26478 type:complete len:263 (-) Transcript_17363:17-805(-)